MAHLAGSLTDLDEDTQQPIVVAEEGEAFTEVVVMEARVNPPVILDKTAGIDLDPDLVSEAVGVVHISSLYDFDGVEVAPITLLGGPATSSDDAPRPCGRSRPEYPTRKQRWPALSS